MGNVLYEVADRVATLTLNRPQSLNAVNPEMIVRGAGDHFMAGGDLKWFREQTTQPGDLRRAHFTDLIERVHASMLNFRRMDKPVIAAVHGAVAGFGLSLMLAADLALAADSAYFTLAYSNIALSPDGGATWSLPHQVGLKQAMEISLLGERFDAARAQSLGIVNRVVPARELDEQAQRLARRLADGPAQALANTKALLYAASELSLDEQLRAEQESFTECAMHPDFSEGLTAFFERRKAAYGPR